MKKIKIKFSGFWKGFNYKEWLIYKILTEHYDVEVCEDADYVFCSCFGDSFVEFSFYEYLTYPQVRIMVTGENYIPDFNFIDYAISVYPLTFGDRYFYFPTYTSNSTLHLHNINRNYDNKTLAEKPYFANFIASHESEYSIRGDFFKKLCKYKRVESPGSYLNNMEDSTPIAYEKKQDFQKKCKFTLCFESTKHEGFVTEKIVDAFLADTIPIYYGSDTAKEIFNPNAFIHVPDYDSFDDAIKRIIELDNDDEAYLDMLRQPILNDKDLIKNKLNDLRSFLDNIFDQPIEKAYRRSRVHSPYQHSAYLIYLRDIKKKFKDGSLFYDEYSGTQILKFSLRKISARFKSEK